MAKAATAVTCSAVVAEIVAAVKDRKAELEKAAKAEGKKDGSLSKDQVGALLQQAWDEIETSKLINAALDEARAELGL